MHGPGLCNPSPVTCTRLMIRAQGSSRNIRVHVIHAKVCSSANLTLNGSAVMLGWAGRLTMSLSLENDLEA